MGGDNLGILGCSDTYTDTYGSKRQLVKDRLDTSKSKNCLSLFVPHHTRHSWASKLQSVVTLSTTEAEYVAAVQAGQEIIWLQNLLSEFGYSFSGPSTLYIDNQSALQVARDPEHHGRMKHLDLRFYWLRDVVDQGLIKPEYLPTADMPADIMTKALGRNKVPIMCELLGLRM